MPKKIKGIEIEPGCISCGTCAAICPEIFEIKGVSQVRESADFEKNEDEIREVAEICPVNVIRLIESE
ncbi:ferredoxin [Candidatus Babeliales bacterium]|nr:ferredoxin [Candidatus Babeliales bacterium]